VGRGVREAAALHGPLLEAYPLLLLLGHTPFEHTLYCWGSHPAASAVKGGGDVQLLCSQVLDEAGARAAVVAVLRGLEWDGSGREVFVEEGRRGVRAKACWRAAVWPSLLLLLPTDVGRGEAL
jgi:hypothetical protein